MKFSNYASCSGFMADLIDNSKFSSFFTMSSFGTECMKYWDMYQIKTDNTNCVKNEI